MVIVSIPFSNLASFSLFKSVYWLIIKTNLSVRVPAFEKNLAVHFENPFWEIF